MAPRMILSLEIVSCGTISDVGQQHGTNIGCQKGDWHGNNGLRKRSSELGWGLQGEESTKIGINTDIIILEATARWKEVIRHTNKDIKRHMHVGSEYHFSLILCSYSSNPSSAFFTYLHFLKCKVNA